MSMKDCMEHLYSWDYTIPDALGCPGCAERERIIKLLEPLAICDEICNSGCYPEDCSAPSFRYAIALIKGENNEPQ